MKETSSTPAHLYRHPRGRRGSRCRRRRPLLHRLVYTSTPGQAPGVEEGASVEEEAGVEDLFNTSGQISISISSLPPFIFFDLFHWTRRKTKAKVNNYTAIFCGNNGTIV